jgi:hypothetical protein
MALFKKDKTEGPLPPGTQPSAEPYGTPVVNQQPRGDYSKGHPGLPPKNYKAPKEKEPRRSYS